MNKVFVLGMGPGSKAYIPPVTVDVIGQCDVLIGGERHLQYFQELGKEMIPIKADLPAILDYVMENREHKKIGFLLSGDTGFYSMLTYLKKHFKTNELEVYPGISSFQYLLARIGETWQDAYVGSLHGREFNLVQAIKENEKVIVLTDHKYTPSKIASILLENHMKDIVLVVGENLSYESERIVFGKPEEIVEHENFEMSVVVIMKDDRKMEV
ncbi:MAG: precorrin-6y C5,15-methyltransferase (decarboxylating) subunit CbiE [Bacillota bacterium]